MCLCVCVFKRQKPAGSGYQAGIHCKNYKNFFFFPPPSPLPQTAHAHTHSPHNYPAPLPLHKEALAVATSGEYVFYC